jgi:hypothetical protein
MKKVDARDLSTDDDMLPEYDFASGIRGKHYKSYRDGHKVKVHKSDGTTIIQYFTLEDGAVMLEPDVREYFPDSESVNKALRSLIAIVPKNRKKVKSRSKSRL